MYPFCTTNQWQRCSQCSSFVFQLRIVCDSWSPTRLIRTDNNITVAVTVICKAEVCIQDKYLNTISRVEVWAEGVEGDFDIEVEWIGATNSAVSI